MGVVVALKKMVLRNWSSVVQVAAVLLLFVFVYAVLFWSGGGERPLPKSVLLNASGKALESGNCTPLFEEDRTRAYTYYVEAGFQGTGGEPEFERKFVGTDTGKASIFERKFAGTDAAGNLLMSSKTISKSGNTTLVEHLDAVTLECKGMEMVVEQVNVNPSRQELPCPEIKAGSFASVCEETFEKQEGEGKVETFLGNITATGWKSKRENLRVWRAEGISVPVKVEVEGTAVWTLAEYE